jgi:tetratricopeptide (TPR) repeat protein
LRAAIAWSYRRLPPSAQRLFRALGIFSGGATLDAIQAICAGDGGDSVPDVSTLIDQSLLALSDTGLGGRYTLLVTLRAFAQEELRATGELGALRERHAAFFLAEIEAAEAGLIRVDLPTLDGLAAEYDNIHAALTWAAQHDDGAAGLRMAGVLWRFWVTRGYHLEGLKWIARFLVTQARPVDDTEHITRAKALYGNVVLHYRLNHYDLALEAALEMVALRREIGEPGAIANSLNALGNVYNGLRRFDDAASAYAECIAICRRRGDRAGLVKPLLNLGKLERDRHDFTAALAHYQESLSLGAETGEDDEGRGILLNNIGDLLILLDQPTSAEDYLRQSLALFSHLGATWGVSMSVLNLGRVAQRQGDDAEAMRYYADALRMRQELGDNTGMLGPITGLVQVLIRQGRLDDAITAACQGLARLEQYTEPGDRIELLRCCAALARARQRLELAAELYGATCAQLHTWNAIGDPADQAQQDIDERSLRDELLDFATLQAAGAALSLEEALARAWEATT